MRIRWTRKAASDLVRLEEFLRAVNELAAARMVLMLAAAPERLLSVPRIGERVEEYGEREVRRLLAGSYEFHYEILPDEIAILHVRHAREER